MNTKEYIVSINKQGAIYFFKACRWGNLVAISMMVMCLLQVLGVLIPWLIYAKEIEVKLQECVWLKEGYDVMAVLAIAFMSLSVFGIVLGVLLYRAAHSCMDALLTGEDACMEDALRKYNKYFLVYGIGVIACLCVLMLCLLSWLLFCFAEAYALF